MVMIVQRRVAFGLAWFAASIAMGRTSYALDAAPAPATPPTSTDAPRMIRGLVQASLIGSTYRWRYSEPGDALYQPHGNGDYTNTAYSKFALGMGYRFGLGVVWRKVLPNLSLSATVAYEGEHHETTYPSGAFGPFHASSASLRFYEFEFRAMLDRSFIKPYIAVETAWVHLALPQQEVIWTPAPPYAYHFVDAWKSGESRSVAFGVLYEIFPNLSAGLRVGFRRLAFFRTNEGTLEPHAEFAQSVSAALGVEWWP
jgi:hypothetical protein